MRLSTYADLAVRLVNTLDPPDTTARPATGTDRLGTLEDLRGLMGEHRRWALHGTPRDIEVLRRLRGRLRAVFDDAAGGRHHEAVTRLNALLEECLVRPQVSGHDGEGWHLHLSSDNETSGSAYAAAAVMGLAVLVTEIGIEQLGTCQAPGCGNVYLDTSTNRTRRYCGERCASRVNVAAYRSRRRRDSGRSDSRDSGRSDSRDSGG